MRKLVTIRTIQAIDAIPGADLIATAQVDGWCVVIKKGELQVGEQAVYFEIDSFLPESDARFAFLMKAGTRIFEGQRGHRLRTISLRGQLSQGLLLPLAQFPEFANVDPDADLASLIAVKKWEAEIPANLSGMVRGAFPGFIRKTDQERCQNLAEQIFADLDAQYEVSIKLDGTSFTGYFHDGDTGVCSRNLELQLEQSGNTLVDVFKQSGLQSALQQLARNLAIQGELMGPGIQGNREQLKSATLFVFEIFDIASYTYLPAAQRQAVLDQLQALGAQLPQVPILHAAVSLRQLGIDSMTALLALADGPSLKHPLREGLVFKRIDGSFSFKVISNAFLLKEG